MSQFLRCSSAADTKEDGDTIWQMQASRVINDTHFLKGQMIYMTQFFNPSQAFLESSQSALAFSSFVVANEAILRASC